MPCARSPQHRRRRSYFVRPIATAPHSYITGPAPFPRFGDPRRLPRSNHTSPLHSLFLTPSRHTHRFASSPLRARRCLLTPSSFTLPSHTFTVTSPTPFPFYPFPPRPFLALSWPATCTSEPPTHNCSCFSSCVWVVQKRRQARWRARTGQDARNPSLPPAHSTRHVTRGPAIPGEQGSWNKLSAPDRNSIGLPQPARLVVSVLGPCRGTETRAPRQRVKRLSGFATGPAANARPRSDKMRITGSQHSVASRLS